MQRWRLANLADLKKTVMDNLEYLTNKIETEGEPLEEDQTVFVLVLSVVVLMILSPKMVRNLLIHTFSSIT